MKKGLSRLAKSLLPLEERDAGDTENLWASSSSRFHLPPLDLPLSSRLLASDYDLYARHKVQRFMGDKISVHFLTVDFSFFSPSHPEIFYID